MTKTASSYSTGDGGAWHNKQSLVSDSGSRHNPGQLTGLNKFFGLRCRYYFGRWQAEVACLHVICLMEQRAVFKLF